jgi:hypothetical protein
VCFVLLDVSETNLITSVELDRNSDATNSWRLSVSIVPPIIGGILCALAIESRLLTSENLIISDFWLFGSIFPLLGGVFWVIATRQ